MKPNEIPVCPCTLKEGFNTYSPYGLRVLFNRRKVSHILDFNPPEIDQDTAELLRQNSAGISISGAQFKQSLVVDNHMLRLTKPGERGTFILKPVPYRPPFGNADVLPANEHLTMQIARQVFGIETAVCALVFFRNGQPAYITRRFDYAADGSKIAQEDFASIAGKSRNENGESFRYHGSYEDIAILMKKHVAAYTVEIEKFFERVVFNYLFSNGDAHLKNFSVQQTTSGDYLLSPAYDLINTSIHIPNDSFFALEEGLFSDGFTSESFRKLGFYAYDDFLAFGIRIGIPETRVIRMLQKYMAFNPMITDLIHRSYLPLPVQKNYGAMYKSRLAMLNNAFSCML